MNQGVRSVTLSRSDLEQFGLRRISVAFSRKLSEDEIAKHIIKNLIVAHPHFASIRELGNLPFKIQRLGSSHLNHRAGRYVKFRQCYGTIPVFGSFISVFLERSKTFRAMIAHVGDLRDVPSIAEISPANAISVARSFVQGADVDQSKLPQLQFRFDPDRRRWRMAYEVMLLPQMDYDAERDYQEEIQRTCLVDAVDGAALLQYVHAKHGCSTYVRPGSNLKPISLMTGESDTFQLKACNGAIAVHDHNSDNFRSPLMLRNDSKDDFFVSCFIDAKAYLEYLTSQTSRSDWNTMMPLSIHVNFPRKEALFSSHDKHYVFGQHKKDGARHSWVHEADIFGHELAHGLIHEAKSESGNHRFGREALVVEESYCDIFGLLLRHCILQSEDDWAQFDWTFASGIVDAVNTIGDNLPRNIASPQPPFDKFKHRQDITDQSHAHQASVLHSTVLRKIIIKAQPHYSPLAMLQLFVDTFQAGFASDMDFAQSKDALKVMLDNDNGLSVFVDERFAEIERVEEL